MKRTERLFATMVALYGRADVRAAELARTFAVSERTVYRDLQALSRLGVPIAARPGVGYALAPPVAFPPVLLEPGQALALVLSGLLFQAQASGRLGADLAAGLERVGAGLPPEMRAAAERLVRLIAFLPPTLHVDASDSHLPAILQALETHRVLHLVYWRMADGQTVARDVEPHMLHYTAGGEWVVNGYCRLRQQFRSFRLSRIRSLQVKAETFVPRVLAPLAKPEVEVRVRFEPRIVPTVREHQHYSFSHEQGREMIYRVHDLREIQSWLLGYGGHVEIIAPERLRQMLRSEAEALLARLA